MKTLTEGLAAKLIKTWQEKLDTVSDERIVSSLMIQQEMQAEIDELRAALQERDAEIEGWKADQKENLANQCNLQATINAQRKVLEQALEALQILSCEADSFSVSGVYFNESCMGHKGLDMAETAITAIQEQLE